MGFVTGDLAAKALSDCCSARKFDPPESRGIKRLVRRSASNLRAEQHLGNFMRTLALPDAVEQWSLTTLREKLVKIGAKIVRHGRYIVFQMAEVAIPLVTCSPTSSAESIASERRPPNMTTGSSLMREDDRTGVSETRPDRQYRMPPCPIHSQFRVVGHDLGGRTHRLVL